jgi:hypothetical protein
MEMSDQLHTPTTISLGENPSTLLIEGWWTVQLVWTFCKRETFHSYMESNTKSSSPQPIHYTMCHGSCMCDGYRNLVSFW